MLGAFIFLSNIAIAEWVKSSDIGRNTEIDIDALAKFIDGVASVAKYEDIVGINVLFVNEIFDFCGNSSSLTGTGTCNDERIFLVGNDSGELLLVELYFGVNALINCLKIRLIWVIDVTNNLGIVVFKIEAVIEGWF